MPKNFSRSKRVGDVIHRTLALAISREFKDPRIGMVTVMDVRITPDLKFARVYITILEEEKKNETLKILNEAAGFFRRYLASTLQLRTIPHVRFVFDGSLLRGVRIASLLDRVVRDRA